MNLADYGIEVGNFADLIVLDATSVVSALAELAQPLFGMKRGRKSFNRAAATLAAPPRQPVGSFAIR